MGKRLVRGSFCNIARRISQGRILLAQKKKNSYRLNILFNCRTCAKTLTWVPLCVRSSILYSRCTIMYCSARRVWSQPSTRLLYCYYDSRITMIIAQQHNQQRRSDDDDDDLDGRHEQKTIVSRSMPDDYESERYRGKRATRAVGYDWRRTGTDCREIERPIGEGSAVYTVFANSRKARTLEHARVSKTCWRSSDGDRPVLTRAVRMPANALNGCGGGDGVWIARVR